MMKSPKDFSSSDSRLTPAARRKKQQTTQHKNPAVMDSFYLDSARRISQITVEP